jgi:hypothetical protein
MRCLTCGGKMQVTQSEQHESVNFLEYYLLTCLGCGDTDRRLLTRRQILPANIPDARPVSQCPSPPKPQKTIARKDTFQSRRMLMKLLQEINNFQSRRSDVAALLRDPKKFIETLVRSDGSK